SLYLLVGSRSPNYDPTRQIDMLGLSDKVRFTGYVSPEDFPYYLAASDVCLNLRYPTAGETSASLLRIMGAGVPVLVSRTGSFEELPDNAAGKIDIGDIEEELLLEYLLLLSKRPDLRDAMSRAAREYVAHNHSMEQAALGYLHLLAPGVDVGIARRPTTASIPSTIAIKPAPTVTVSTAQNPLLAQVAEAAAEIGITEEHGPLLRHISAALEGIIPPSGDLVNYEL
ncbi:MAG: glycosyltransferase, partial [Chloroflexia bacterium]